MFLDFCRTIVRKFPNHGMRRDAIGCLHAMFSPLDEKYTKEPQIPDGESTVMATSKLASGQSLGFGLGLGLGPGLGFGFGFGLGLGFGVGFGVGVG